MTQFYESDGMPITLEDTQTLRVALSTVEELLKKKPARDVRLYKSREGYWSIFTDGMTAENATVPGFLLVTKASA